MSNQIVQSIFTIFTSLVLAVSGMFTPKAHIAITQTPVDMQAVLGEATQSGALQFNVNVPAVFNDTATFNKDISAPNLVTSVQGTTGAVALTAGSGITLDGLKITNSDLGSSQNIFKTISNGTTTFSAGSNTDTLTFAASGGTSLAIDTTNKKVTFSSTAPDYTQSGWTVSGTSVYPTTITDNIGIGTTTPTTPLYVSGASTLAGSVTIGGASTDSITFTGRVKDGTSLLPDTDLGSDLGASGHRFNNLWVANINSNSSQSFSGQTTFSYAPTDTTISQASVLINPTTSATDGQLLGLGIAGYQRALIDAEGDMILGYNSATSAPATSYPLTIYGHSGTNVAYVDASGNLALAGGAVVKPLTDSTSALNIANSTGTSFVTFDTTNSRVGIGTSSPGANLEVYNNGGSGPEILLNNPRGSIGDLATISVKDQSGTYRGAIVSSIHSGGASDWYIKSGAGSATVAGLGTVATFLGSGNVGIGTTSPGKPLVVVGNASISNILYDTYIWGDSGNPLYLGSSAGSRWVIDTGSYGGPMGSLHPYPGLTYDIGSTSNPVGNIYVSGNVGIGTTAPNGLLDISKAISAAPSATVGNYLSLSASTLTDNSTAGSGVATGATFHSIAQNTLAATNTSVTTTNAYGLYLGGAPLKGTNETLTNSTALNIAAGSALSSTTNGYGLQVNAPTGATNNYAAIFSGGNVGIGTTSPGSLLDVNGTTQLRGTSGGVGLYVDNTGRVGVNTTVIDTAYQFKVNGSGAYTGSMSSGGNVITNGNILMYTNGQANITNPYTNGAYDSLNVGTTYFSAPLLFTTGGSETMRLVSGLVGIGTTAPVSKLDVQGAVTGKALMSLNETGDQALLTASASGVTKLSVLHNGLVNAAAGGLATYTKAGTISDTDFTDTAVNGMLGVDSTDSRLYVRSGGAWHYIAFTAGFQIPNNEAFVYNQSSKSFDTSQPLNNGDFLIPFVEKHLSDGGLHGLYTSFTSAKPLLFATEDSQIASLSAQLAGIQTSAVTYATVADLTTINTLVSTIQTTFTALTNQVSTLASTVASLVTRVTNLENQTQTGVVTIPGGKKGITVTFAHVFSATPLVVVSGATLPHYALSVAASSFTLTFDTTLGSDTPVSWVATIPTAGTTSTSFDSAPTATPTPAASQPGGQATPTPSVAPSPTATPSASATPIPTPSPTPSETPSISPSPTP